MLAAFSSRALLLILGSILNVFFKVQGSQKSLARHRDSEVHEITGRSLRCSGLKTGGFGLNTNLNAIIHFFNVTEI